ncbi:MAG: hypothetical protein RR904_04985 [Bacilli bacterium]
MKKEKAIINIISKDPNEILEVSDIYDLNEIIEILKINNCLDEHIEILKERILDLLEDAVTNYDYEYEFDKAVNQTENKEIEISEAYYAERIYEDGFLNIDTCVLDENKILERILSEISLINLKERYYEYNIDDYNDYNDDYRNSDFYSEEKIIDNLFENL